MRTAFSMLPVLMLALLPISGCSSPFAGDTLIALPVTGQPTEEDWERAVPLDLTVWMGNVNIPEDIVALDMETSHRSTPECHHGPDTSDPIAVRVQALYDTEKLYLFLKWPDRTRDQELGTWEAGPEGWTARPGADDGIALLWEPVGDSSRAGSESVPFRCQYTCHMVEVDVYDGGTKMRMGMKAPGKNVMDLWRWRSSVTGFYDLADDMVVDGSGKRGDEGQIIPRVNKAEVSIGPETIASKILKDQAVPYYLTEKPGGRQGNISASARWDDGIWYLHLTRALDTADPDDVIYTPGDRFPFSIAVFDNTFSEHHVSAGGAVLVMWQGDRSREKRRYFDDPMDF